MINKNGNIIGVNKKLLYRRKTDEEVYQVLCSNKFVTIKNTSAQMFTFLISDGIYTVDEISTSANLKLEIVVKMIENLILLKFADYVSNFRSQYMPLKLSASTHLNSYEENFFIMNFEEATIDLLDYDEYHSFLNYEITRNMFQARKDYLIGRKYFNTHNDKTLKQESMLNIYVVLSYNCNLSCSYCFEKDKELTNDHGSSNDYLKKLDSISKFHNIILTLYGGEPLLEGNRQDIINLIDFTKNKLCLMRIITNGICVPQFIEDFLKIKERIIEFVITIDGTKCVHDIRRFYKGGKGTFDDVMNSVIILNSLKFRVKIRINLDENNLIHQIEFLHFLKKLELDLQLIAIEYHRVENKTNLDFKPISLVKCYQLLKNIVLQNTGITINFAEPILNFIYNASRDTLPSIQVKSCDLQNIVVIDKNGKMNICNEAMHLKDFSIEKIHDSSELINKYESKCSSCSLFYACFGGCSLKRYYFNEQGRYYCNRDEIQKVLNNFMQDMPKLKYS